MGPLAVLYQIKEDLRHRRELKLRFWGCVRCPTDDRSRCSGVAGTEREKQERREEQEIHRVILSSESARIKD